MDHVALYLEKIVIMKNKQTKNQTFLSAKLGWHEVAFH